MSKGVHIGISTTERPAGPHIEFKGSTPCPFCGRDVSCAKTPRMVVMHAMPMCETFERLEPDEFLAAVNDALKLRPPSS